MEPVLDDAAARSLLGRRSPDTVVVTTRDLVQRAVSKSLIDRDEPEEASYADMLAKGYPGAQGTFGAEKALEVGPPRQFELQEATNPPQPAGRWRRR
jgi:hypothetical protein